MRNIIIGFGLFFTFSLVYASNEVSQLRDIAREVEDHRDLTIDCLIEIKLSKQKGWGSEQCLRYQSFAKSTLPAFQSKVKAAATLFNNYSKSTSASKRRVKRGLKELLIIQEGMLSIKSISNKIKNASNT